MKKKIINFVFAAVLFLAAGTAVIYAYANYTECRCSQSSPGISNQAASCCYLAAYRSNFPSDCCQNSNSAWVAASSGDCSPCAGISVCRGDTQGAGGWVISSATIANDCASCCGNGYVMSTMDTSTTCGSTTYWKCKCKPKTATAQLVASAAIIDDGNGSCVPGYGDARASEALGIALNGGTVSRCTQRGETGGYNAIFNDTYNTCKSEFGNDINGYLNSNTGGYARMCYIGGGTTTNNGGSVCTNVGTKYYLGCKVVKN